MTNPLLTNPDYAEFVRLTRKGNVIPLSREYLSDFETPATGFRKIAKGQSARFLLESVEHGEHIGRYSFIGTHPLEVLATGEGENATRLLEEKMKEFRLARAETLPPFSGGWVGYLDYENVRFFEKIRLKEKPGIGMPQALFFIPSRLLIFDHIRRTMKTVVFVKTGTNLRNLYKCGISALNEMARALNRPEHYAARLRPSGTDISQENLKLRSNMSPAAFRSKVQRIKKYIRQGDCIQVVLSQRFDAGRIDDTFEVYRTLRSVNPSPYLFYFECKGNVLVGSSPEMLVKKTGRRVELRPIAGTRKRGRNDSEDQSLEKDLRASRKELAEHLMLVDLGRNDLGRVCKFNSVKVDDFARVERYSHVMHLVSQVSGVLKSGKNAFDLLRAAFPAGTLTGAPKVRAMEIIDELEEDQRGPYAGCLGYLSFTGDMDMCITIRTIMIRGTHAYVQSGAGIVFDSRPHFEYLETVNKAKALFRAIAMEKSRRHS